MSSSGLLTDRQIRFEENSDSDSGVSEVDKSTDVYFSDVFSQLDSEIESSRCRTRSEFINQVSQDHMTKSLQKPSCVLNKTQSVTTASSRRSSASQHGMRERSTSIIEMVRGRVVESQSMFQTRSPSARPSSAASFLSTNDDFFEIDAQISSRSSRQFPYTATARSVVSSSYLKQDPTFGRVKKGGATEGVKPCKRMESVLNEDLAAVVNDLARQCCDVLGPSLCKECTKNTKRFNNLIIFHRKHPDIDETAMTLYAIPLIQRMYPELGKSEIKAKLASGEIGQQIKIKINRSKDIENFDEKVTDYFPEKYRRQRMRRQRIEAGAPGVVRMEDDDVILVEPFNPSHYADKKSESRKLIRRNSLFPTDFMASGVSTPSSVHTLSRVSSPEPLLPTPETESDDNEEVIDYGQCEPTLMDLTWVRDFPRFHVGRSNDYQLPVWKRSDLPPDP